MAGLSDTWDQIDSSLEVLNVKRLTTTSGMSDAEERPYTHSTVCSTCKREEVWAGTNQVNRPLNPSQRQRNVITPE